MHHILRLKKLGIGWTEKKKGRFRGSGRLLLAGQDTCHRGPIVRPRFMSLACVFNAMRGSFGGVAGDGLACQWGAVHSLGHGVRWSDLRQTDLFREQFDIYSCIYR